MGTESISGSSRMAKNYRTRTAELIVGLTANKLLEIAYDYTLYPFVIYKLGIIAGGVAMTIVTFIACLLIIKVYDWSKRDWLGIETMKGLREYDGGNRIGLITSWILNRSKPIIFVFLSLKFDAFITMVYFRHSAYAGMSKRDWRTFTGSILVSNIYWTLACYMGISLFEYAINLSRKLLAL